MQLVACEVTSWLPIPETNMTKAAENGWLEDVCRLPFGAKKCLFSGAFAVSFREGASQVTSAGRALFLELELETDFR